MVKKIRRRRGRKKPEHKSQPSNVVAQALADPTAPWTAADRDYFRKNPDSDHYTRNLFDDELETFQTEAPPLYRAFLTHAEVDPNVRVLVIQSQPGIRARLPCWVRLGLIYALDPQGQTLPVTAESISIFKKNMVLRPLPENTYIDYCATCGNEIEFGALEFQFGGELHGHCRLCSLNKIGNGDLPTGGGIRLAKDPTLMADPNIQRRTEATMKVLKQIKEIMGPRMNYKQRKAMQDLLAMKKPVNPH